MKSLQVFVADSFSSFIYETKNLMLGVRQLLDYHKWSMVHISGKLISNLPCDEEISQGYD